MLEILIALIVVLLALGIGTAIGAYLARKLQDREDEHIRQMNQKYGRY